MHDSSINPRLITPVVLAAGAALLASLLSSPSWGVAAAALAAGLVCVWALSGAEHHQRVLIALRDRSRAIARRDAPSDERPEEAIHADLSAIESQQESERSRRALWLSLPEAVAEPILAIDSGGHIAAFNTEAAGLFAGRDLLGQHIESLFTHMDAIDAWRAASSGQDATARLRLIIAGKPRLFDLFARPWGRSEAAAQTPGRAVLTLRDVGQAAHASRLTTDFVANASHELRTPLAAIKGAVETLEGGAQDDPPIRHRFIRMIGENVDRLEDLTRDLLDLSRLEGQNAAVQESDFDLAECLRASAAGFDAPCAERGLTIEIACDPRVARVRTDKRLLELIVRNLVENATKFAREHTPIRISALPAEEGLVIAVADQGIGIPLDQQSRIFERFYQVDEARSGLTNAKGSGLGLAIVQQAVDALGGRIRVDSVWKQGTTMSVVLPPRAVIQG